MGYPKFEVNVAVDGRKPKNYTINCNVPLTIFFLSSTALGYAIRYVLSGVFVGTHPIK